MFSKVLRNGLGRDIRDTCSVLALFVFKTQSTDMFPTLFQKSLGQDQQSFGVWSGVLMVKFVKHLSARGSALCFPTRHSYNATATKM